MLSALHLSRMASLPCRPSIVGDKRTRTPPGEIAANCGNDASIVDASISAAGKDDAEAASDEDADAETDDAVGGGGSGDGDDEEDNDDEEGTDAEDDLIMMISVAQNTCQVQSLTTWITTSVNARGVKDVADHARLAQTKFNHPSDCSTDAHVKTRTKATVASEDAPPVASTQIQREVGRNGGVAVSLRQAFQAVDS